MLHVQLQGTDCTVRYGERPSALCVLTRWNAQEIVVAVSGDYLQQPDNMVQIVLRPVSYAPDHWLYTPTHFLPYSPLLLAVQRGDVAVVRTLLGRGADPNGHPDGLDAPLAMSVRGRKLEIANLLVDRGADVNVQDSDFGFVLEMAAGYGADADHAGWSAFVKKLVAHGADVNRAGPQGITPLMAAADARDPDPDMVELLLASGANVNATATIRFLALLGMKMPMTAYDLAKAKFDLYKKELGTRADCGDHSDSVQQLQKIMSILAQHGAKSPPR